MITFWIFSAFTLEKLDFYREDRFTVIFKTRGQCKSFTFEKKKGILLQDSSVFKHFQYMMYCNSTPDAFINRYMTAN